MMILDEKSQQVGYEAFPFPYFPPSATFLAQGLNLKPGFFGSICTATTPSTPLVVYIPNYNINFATNTSTFSPNYSINDQISFFNNGFAVATQNQSTAWSSCLACALVDAQVTRNGGTRSSECQQCFTKYCYRGTSDATA
jgi:lysophospholipase